MSKVRYIPFSASEWLEGTHELGDCDRGVYITICSLIWARGGPINEELIKRHSQSHGNAILASLRRLEEAGKIERNGSEIGQKRAEKELENARKRSEKASENSRVRWNNNALGDSSAILSINHKPITNNQESERKNLTPKSPTPVRAAKPPPAEAEREFEDWWKVYPRRDDKGHARKAFIAARKKVPLAELIDAARKFTVQCAGSEKRFIPLPATWLNGERWGDAALTVRAPSGPSGPPPVSLWRNNWDMASAD